ncbi:MAG: hypothetical protein GC206_14860, partial [Alphaproteobacteria bacterium]|nr:hypothetical protein [Alphaproteobacteria bacterium]
MSASAAAKFAPSLPMPALIGVTVVTGVVALVAIVRARNAAAGFIIGSTWFRYIISAFHAITYKSIGPLSISAASSIGVFVIGLMIIKRRLLMINFLTPIYVLLGVVVISGLYNNQLVGMVNVLVKYGFLIVVILCTFEALASMQQGRMLRLLLLAFLPLILFQILSIALGVIKSGENDGSVSYIGGYGHEATFSTMLMTLFIAAIFTTRINPLVKNGLILTAIVGIFLANYRTTILAMAPTLAVYFGLMPVQRFPKKERPFVAAFFILFVCVLFGVASLALGDRFADLQTASSSDINLLKPPHLYSVDESRILSGRPMIWSGYVYGWLDARGLQWFIGFGPESWTLKFRAYAHNTLVNALYEYGPLGVAALIYMWVSMLAAALRVRHGHRNLLVATHISFLMLNMATMPLWMIEGNIMYGLICGYTLYLLHLQRQAPAGAR